MAAQSRIEYHWIEGRVVEQKLSRPPNTKAWRFNTNDPTLVATIEPRGNSFYLMEGVAANPERIVNCVRYYKGLFVDISVPDFSGDMPRPLQINLRERIDLAVSSVLQQWNSFAEETDITGYLKGRLCEIKLEQDGWKVSIDSWTYKRNPKETKIGADLGIILI